jgi:hypothetical protein
MLPLPRRRVVPIEVRRFLGAVAMRASRVRHTGGVFEHSPFDNGPRILVSDLKGALRLSERTIFSRANELEAYDLGCADEVFDFQNETRRPAVRIATLKSGWCVWLDIAEFCSKASESMEAFTADLDFGRLDC